MSQQYPGPRRPEIAFPASPPSDGGMTLEPMQPPDAPLLTGLWADPLTRRFTHYLTDGAQPDAVEAIEFAERLRRAGLGIVFKINDRARRPVGAVSLAAFQDATVGELGVIVARDSRGRGLAGRAMALLAEWAFRERRMRRLEAHVHPDNGTSLRMLARLGFQKEGVRRSYEAEGREGDRILLSLLPEEHDRDDPFQRLSRTLDELRATAGEPAGRREILDAGERCIRELDRRLWESLADAGFDHTLVRYHIDRARTLPFQVAELELTLPPAQQRAVGQLAAQLTAATTLRARSLEGWADDD